MWPNYLYMCRCKAGSATAATDDWPISGHIFLVWKSIQTPLNSSFTMAIITLRVLENFQKTLSQLVLSNHQKGVRPILLCFSSLGFLWCKKSWQVLTDLSMFAPYVPHGVNRSPHIIALCSVSWNKPISVPIPAWMPCIPLYILTHSPRCQLFPAQGVGSPSWLSCVIYS